MKIQKRPIVIGNGIEVKLGMKLYSVSQKSISSYEKGEKYATKWSGEFGHSVSEYTVVYVNEKEVSRSFKTVSSAGCEDRFSLNRCDYALKKMNFFSCIDQAKKYAAKREKEFHVARMKESLQHRVNKIKHLQEDIKKIKKCIDLNSKNTKNFLNKTTASKSC